MKRKLRVGVLSSSISGLSALGVHKLQRHEDIELALVCIDRGLILDHARVLEYWKKKLKKFRRLGFTAMVSGLYIRRLYSPASYYAGDIPENLIKSVDDINSEATGAWLKSLDLDLFISLGNRILKSSTYGAANLGTINVHLGSIPRYRGGPPLFWELYDGQAEAGYTLHWMVDRIDAGGILANGAISLLPAQNLADVVKLNLPRLAEAAVETLSSVVSQLARGDVGPGFAVPIQMRPNTTPTLGQLLRVVGRVRFQADAESFS